MGIHLHCIYKAMHKVMTLYQLYNILKTKYGAIAELAVEVGVTTQTIRLVMTRGEGSDYTEQIRSTATQKAKEILSEKKEAQESEIKKVTIALSQTQQQLSHFS